MTHAVELPALDGRDALGFLAGLGVLRLLTEEARIEARISFNGTSACAILHSPLRSIESLVEAIAEVIDAIPDNGVIPAAPPAFPLAKTGSEPDPMRMPRDRLRQTIEQITGDERGPDLGRWFAALVTDLAVDAKGRAALTPYTAPAGQQSLRSFFTRPLDEVRKNPRLLISEALTRWRRVDDYTGEYLDHRVLRSAADHPSGKSVEAGVPGATWLAVMAFPLLRLTGTGSSPQATLWHTVPGRRQALMVWPLWQQPLNTHAVSALLEHPALRPRVTAEGVAVARACWPPLGVFAVAGASRQGVEGRKSAGVLAPITIRTTEIF
ncbi:hypothetical protein JNW88_18700 [Micromonospora sp. ATA32]|nr:hypothetical protein [Micromonospora sp. ATA32]